MKKMKVKPSWLTHCIAKREGNEGKNKNKMNS